MNTSISLFELLSLAVSITTSFAVFLAVRQIKINRQQLYLATITKCIEHFRSFDKLNIDTTDEKVLWNYIDLVSEELFYFQYDYIPTDVSIEWIDGMIDYLPITDKSGSVLNRGNCIHYLADHGEEFLISFPRIRTSFEISEQYDFTLIYSKEKGNIKSRVVERNRLAKEILKNVRASGV
jgi:hypothetical protein